jgi:hypothetical protein
LNIDGGIEIYELPVSITAGYDFKGPFYNGLES